MKRFLVLILLLLFNISFPQTIIKIGNSEKLKTLSEAISVLKVETVSNNTIIELQSDYDYNLEPIPIILPKLVFTTRFADLSIRPASDRSAPIIWEGQGSGIILVDSASKISLNGNVNNTIKIIVRNLNARAYNENSSDIIFKNYANNIAFRGLKLQSEDNCIKFLNEGVNNFHNITIDGCEISKRQDVARPNIGFGIVMNMQNYIQSSNINIINNSFISMDTIAIKITGNIDSTLIEANHFYQIERNTARLESMIHFNTNGTGNVIRGNYIGGSNPFCEGNPLYIDHADFSAIYFLCNNKGNVVKDNVVSNIIYSTGNFYGINGSGISNVENNIIGGDTTNIILDNAYHFYGILLETSNSEDTVFISGNNVSNILKTAAQTMTSGGMTGIYLNANSTANINGNKIYNLKSNTESFYIDAGLRVISWITTAITNNYIFLNDDSSHFVNLSLNGMGECNIINNSFITITQNPFSNYGLVQYSPTPIRLFNNLFINKGNSAIPFSLMSTNNLNIGNNFYILEDTSNILFTTPTFYGYDYWKKTFNDNSYFNNVSEINIDSLFANTILLNAGIKDNELAWMLNGKGLPHLGIQFDINGNKRSLSPADGPVDIGAFEFDLTSNPPLHRNAVDGFMTNIIENGRVYAELKYTQKVIDTVEYQIITGDKPFPESDSYFYLKMKGDNIAPSEISINYDKSFYGSVNENEARVMMFNDTIKNTFPTSYNKDESFFEASYLTKWGNYSVINKSNLLTSDNNVLMANDYSLSQNYPNPFNPVTTINYSLESESNVQIKVFNILGSEVKTLLNGYQEAGQHRIMFNAVDLPSGIYLYTIKAGNFTATRKMTLLK